MSGSLERGCLTSRVGGCSTSGVGDCSSSGVGDCSSSRVGGCSTSRIGGCSSSRDGGCSISGVGDCSSSRVGTCRLIVDDIVQKLKLLESVFCMSVSSACLSVCLSVCLFAFCLTVCVRLSVYVFLSVYNTARWLTSSLVDCCSPSSSERCSGDGFEITMLKSGIVKLVVVATAAAVSFPAVV